MSTGKKPPKKPTQPFGGIAFGKDGRVRPAFEKLPDYKEGQEHEVGKRFAEFAAEELGFKLVAVPLPETDHDCLLRTEGGVTLAKVQMIEVVERDFLDSLSEGEYLNSGPGKFVITATKQYARVKDDVSEVLSRKIAQKLQKCYSPPAGSELWLLIWTVSSYPLGSMYQNGLLIESPVIKAARVYAATHSLGAFSRIDFMPLPLRPERLWPLGRP